MNRVALHLSLGRERFNAPAQLIRQVLFALFLAQYVLVSVGLWLPLPLFGNTQWPEAVLLVLATTLTVVALSRQLPWQNVISAAILIAAMAGVSQIVGTQSGIPFGDFVYTENVGPRLLGPLPWTVLVVWVLAILSSRGTARLILHPWRNKPTYGFWMLGVTTLLTVLFDFGLDPFATQVKHYWRWNAAGPQWHPAPWLNLFGWTATSLIILVFTTPFLINKRPVEFEPDYYPPAAWLLLNLLFAAAAAAQQLWTAAAVIALVGLLVVTLSVLGTRRQFR